MRAVGLNGLTDITFERRRRGPFGATASVLGGLLSGPRTDTELCEPAANVQTDMREAVLSVSDADLDRLGIGALVSLCRSAGLRGFEELSCAGGRTVVRAEVEAPLDESRLRALEYVERWELLAESDGGYEYLLAFTTPAFSGESTEHVDDLVGNCDSRVTERGATLSFVGPTEAVRDAVRQYEAAGTTPELRKLGPYEGRDRPLDALTERQREVVRTAYDLGYYEVPREASTDDVAAALGIDPSTVAEHLQRGERNLLSRYLASER